MEAMTVSLGRSSRLADWWQLTKPRLNFLVLLTALAGYALAPAGGRHRVPLLAFALGLWMLAASSAMLNMWLEQDSDRLMDRTKTRPLPARRLPPQPVFWVGVGLAFAALLQLELTAGPLTAGLGLLTWASYLLAYTPLKRVSPLSLLVGAVPGALPPVLGWIAGGGGLDEGALALFCLLFLWQIPHFLSIAALYGEQYRAAGIKVLGLEHGPAAAGRSMVLYAAALLPVAVWMRGLGFGGSGSQLLTLGLTAGFVAAALGAALRPSRRSARVLLLASVTWLPLFLLVLILTGRP